MLRAGTIKKLLLIELWVIQELGMYICLYLRYKHLHDFGNFIKFPSIMNIAHHPLKWYSCTKMTLLR